MITRVVSKRQPFSRDMARPGFVAIHVLCKFLAFNMRPGPRALKRRTFKNIRPQSAQSTTGDHHHVYVVLLAPAAARIRKVRLANPERVSKKPVVYVGLTGLTPEERFANHKLGIKSSPLAGRYGIRLLPELYSHLNPMPYEAAAQMERDLTEDLRRAGYTVVGGH